ncbi:MAG: ribbon-helix-helix domain-containing protein [Alphaproteobacteria bacterium]
MASTLRKRSVVIAGHRTSVSLEDVFWEILRGIASARGVSLNRLVAEIDRGRDGNLSSALRVHAVEWLRARAERAGVEPDD